MTGRIFFRIGFSRWDPFKGVGYNNDVPKAYLPVFVAVFVFGWVVTTNQGGFRIGMKGNSQTRSGNGIAVQKPDFYMAGGVFTDFNAIGIALLPIGREQPKIMLVESLRAHIPQGFNKVVLCL